MSGYGLVMKVHELEDILVDLDLKFSKCRIGRYDTDDSASLVPKDENSLPLYCRDAEIFTGSLEQIEAFLRGVTWARAYDNMLGVSNEERRERKEQDVRNETLVKQLKDEKLERCEKATNLHIKRT